MRANDAVRLLRDRIEAPLHRPLTVKSGTLTLETTPWDLGLRVDVAAAVRTAQGQTSSNAVARVWRRVFSHPRRVVAASPKWQRSVLDARLQSMADKIHTDPQTPAIDSSSGFLVFAPGRPGVELDRDASGAAIADAIQLGDRDVRLVTTDISPPSVRNAFQKVILVRAGENKLYLYENGVVAETWPVATGSSTYATPTGTWKVVEKDVDPVWYNPGSSWSAGMPRSIGPGPNNPLGQRALALDAPGILIHGTPDRTSIGYSVSHGCVRMLAENVQELFDSVEEGTPVVIVNAAPAQARSTAPVTTDAAQSAAVNF
jgi:lipoprotein-anchoring transpeptidase ErfK/SrfK